MRGNSLHGHPCTQLPTGQRYHWSGQSGTGVTVEVSEVSPHTLAGKASQDPACWLGLSRAPECCLSILPRDLGLRYLFFAPISEKHGYTKLHWGQIRFEPTQWNKAANHPVEQSSSYLLSRCTLVLTKSLFKKQMKKSHSWALSRMC